jgi:uncharacterized damage-inducible protein DinB
MNRRLYAAARKLPQPELSKDRGAFFGSIMGTLNHICVADTIWLHRFAAHPARFPALEDLSAFPMPGSLGATISDDILALWPHRQALDHLIEPFIQELDADALSTALVYTKAGAAQRKSFAFLLQHFFNHQTHHRGQVSTLLFQSGVDVGVTDLMALIPGSDA